MNTKSPLPLLARASANASANAAEAVSAPPAKPASPVDALQRVFGHAAFRGSQEAVIAHVLAGGDALAVMPTGGGKSLCYQIPALLRPGTAVVVSPLIALMQDQVSGLLQSGVRAAAITSALTPAARLEAERALREGRLDVLYVAPERILLPAFRITSYNVCYTKLLRWRRGRRAGA